MKHALEVYLKKNMIFHSDRHWLHPLFELEQFLNSNTGINPSELLVKDKIIGKAAALLMIYLGIGRVEGELMSELGKDALEKAGVDYAFDKLVDRIICATEGILKDEFDPRKAHELLSERAGRAL